VLRALVACGWFGIQTWIGGQAIYSMLRILWPAFADISGGVWICFLAFWALNMAVIWRGIETIKILEGIGAPFMLAIGLLLLWWITGKAADSSRPQRAKQISHHRRVHALLHPIAHRYGGFWATVALNIPDFTRYAKSQRIRCWPSHRTAHRHDTVFVHRVAVTSASVVLFGEAIWIRSRYWAAFISP